MNFDIYIITFITFSPLIPTILNISNGNTNVINKNIFTFKLLNNAFIIKNNCAYKRKFIYLQC